MGVPSNSVQIQGQGSTSADQLNTYVQGSVNVAALRSFVGLGGMTVFMQGTNSPGDGGQGEFYWNPTSSATDDDGATTIAPPASGTYGRWLRLTSESAQTAPYDVAMGYSPTPPTSTQILVFTAVRAVSFPANMAGSKVAAPNSIGGTNPSATTALTILYNDASIGSISYATSGAATISTTALSMNAGDTLALKTPSTLNSLVGVSVTFAGTRVG